MGAKLSDEIRDAVRKSGWTCYRIAQVTGISQATLSRFMNGKTGISLEYLDRIGELIGIHVVVKSKKPKG
jgi:transcriptional regulator with XRE-family HTH domain